MFIITSPEVQTAITAVVIAVLGLVLAWLRYLTTQVGTNRKDINGVGQKVEKVGAGALRAPVLYNQLADPRSDGTLAPQRTDECGEEVCAMVINWVHGVPVDADYLRFLIRGATGGARTSATDLVDILARCNVGAVQHSDSWTSTRALIETAIGQGRVVAVLGYWVSPSVLHWVLVHQCSVNGITYNDPWGGLRSNLGWTTAQQHYGGQAVEVQQWPDPTPARVH